MVGSDSSELIVSISDRRNAFKTVIGLDGPFSIGVLRRKLEID